jgi:hypothetical protein
MIYNRWGQTIFVTNNSITGWDGSGFNSGRFYYRIRLGGRVFKGLVDLKR